MANILFVEDDTMIASGVTYALEAEGYETTHAANANDAIAIIRNTNFDLAILDMQLPDGTGFDVSDKLKETNTAVIFLTVVDEEDDIIRAFDDGAADYIVKPFRVRELLARIRRTLSLQNSNEKATTMIMFGNTQIDTESGKVFADGNVVELTALEYRLLLIFATNKGVLLSRADLRQDLGY